MRRLAWLFPLVFVALAATYVMAGDLAAGVLYAGLAAGLVLYGSGVQSGSRPMQWFGAAVSGFIVVILLWLAFGR